jgi:hypothetical protein
MGQWLWEPSMIERDSGGYVPGDALRIWREIEGSDKVNDDKPKRLVSKSALEVQADVMRIADETNNDAASRVAAYRLAFEMAQQIAEFEATKELR